MIFSDSMLCASGGLSGPSYVDSSMTWSASTSASTPTTPTLSVGDFMVAVCISTATGRTWSATGWTSVTQVSASHSVAIFKRTATGSDSFTFNISGGLANGLVFVYVCRGATTVSADNLAAATFASADPQVASSMSVTAGRMLLALLDINSNANTLTSGPSGMNSRQQQFTNNTPRGAMYDAPIVATGASGTKSFDISAATFGTAFLIEIQ